LPQLRTGRRAVARLVDVKRIPELAVVGPAADGGLSIGAAVPLADIAGHREVRGRWPLLAQCCDAVGAWPLRQRATMAGNVCNASPAADTAVALLALEARVVAAGPAGARAIPMAGFFRGPGQTALAEGELVTAIELPAASAGWSGRYLRLSRRRGMDLATVGVLVSRGGNGTPAYRVALAAVAPVPLRVPEAEAILDRGGPAAAARAAGAAREACRPITDLRGTADYRREMVGVLVARGAAALA
jgi:carbon-monoxide dehydrogenase medium subunit